MTAGSGRCTTGLAQAKEGQRGSSSASSLPGSSMVRTDCHALALPKLPSLIEWMLNHLHASHLHPDVALFQWLSTNNRPTRLKQDAIGYTDALITNWYDKLKEKKEDKINRPEFTDPVYISWFYDVRHRCQRRAVGEVVRGFGSMLAPKSAGEFKTLVQAMRGKCARNPLLAEVRAAKKPIDTRPLALISASDRPCHGPRFDGTLSSHQEFL